MVGQTAARAPPIVTVYCEAPDVAREGGVNGFVWKKRPRRKMLRMGDSGPVCMRGLAWRAWAGRPLLVTQVVRPHHLTCRLPPGALPRQDPPLRCSTHAREAEAGAFARWLKIELTGSPKVVGETFLDSDNLESLHQLLNFVAVDVQKIVVLGSGSIYSRPWCIAEMAIAHLNAVSSVVLAMPGYTHLSTAMLARIRVQVALAKRSFTGGLLQMSERSPEISLSLPEPQVISGERLHTTPVTGATIGTRCPVDSRDARTETQAMSATPIEDLAPRAAPCSDALFG